MATSSARADADVAVAAAEGSLAKALERAAATSTTVVAAAESAHAVSVVDAGLSFASTAYGAVANFFVLVSRAADAFVGTLGTALVARRDGISGVVTAVMEDRLAGVPGSVAEATRRIVSAGLERSAADARAELSAYATRLVASVDHAGALAVADAFLVVQEAVAATVFVHAAAPGLAAITAASAAAVVTATDRLVAASDGLAEVLSGLAVSADLGAAAAAVRRAVATTAAETSHLVRVTSASGRASRDVAAAGVVAAEVIGVAAIAATDAMTAALVERTLEVGRSWVALTAACGAAATAATASIGVARIDLERAMGVADVTWAGSVTRAQVDYDTLLARGRVEAVKQLSDPFVAMRQSHARIAGDLRRDLVLDSYDRDLAKEAYQSGSGGFAGDWSRNWSMVVGGVVQCVGAVGEVVVGLTTLATAIVMGSTVAGIPAALATGAVGLGVTLHGLDTMVAGFQTVVTGVPQRTLTAQALDSLTGSEFAADVIDGTIGMVGGLAATKVLRLATMTDDMGRCASMFSRAYLGACFTPDTLVHVTALADGEESAQRAGHVPSTAAVATAPTTQCLAIAKVPIGARVLAGNPRPDEFDDSFPEPVQSEWARVSFLIVRNDLSVVEAEFIRPRAWIEHLGLVKGARLDLAVPELEIDGLAEVTAVRACPPIAEGEGRVVTGRFVTREAINVVTVRLANGTEIRATDVHPVWSVDREDWVPAGKLEPGEQVNTLAGPVAVANVERLESPLDVYNIEVHGEHVFRVTADGVLVHNACPHDIDWTLLGPKGGFLKAGEAVSGLEFKLPKGWRLSFPDQSWYGHTEGKLLSELVDAGLLQPGRFLNIEGTLAPCSSCKNLMKMMSEKFGMGITYEDAAGNVWRWVNGVTHAS